jgi:DNA-binding NtrC family response regulator
MDMLVNHAWPGNVREMANAMEHAYILSAGGTLEPEHFPTSVRVPAAPPQGRMQPPGYTSAGYMPQPQPATQSFPPAATHGFPAGFGFAEPMPAALHPGQPAPQAPFGATPQPLPSIPRTLEEIEMECILEALKRHNGSKTAAANELNISVKTMYNKLNKYQERQAG